MCYISLSIGLSITLIIWQFSSPGLFSSLLGSEIATIFRSHWALTSLQISGWSSSMNVSTNCASVQLWVWSDNCSKQFTHSSTVEVCRIFACLSFIFLYVEGPNQTRRPSTNSFQVGSPRHATNKSNHCNAFPSRLSTAISPFDIFWRLIKLKIVFYSRYTAKGISTVPTWDLHFYSWNPVFLLSGW
jgi:hypothetical protein